MLMMDKKGEFKFEVINVIGVVSEGNKGWKKELTRVSWNGKPPKYDLRDWNENHEKMGKGITLTEDELRKLAKILGTEVEFLNQNKN
jgi:hypothetical protein